MKRGDVASLSMLIFRLIRFLLLIKFIAPKTGARNHCAATEGSSRFPAVFRKCTNDGETLSRWG